MSEKRVLLVGYCESHVVSSKIGLLHHLGYSAHVLDIGSSPIDAELFRPDSIQVSREIGPSRRWSIGSAAYREAVELARSAGALSEDGAMAAAVRDAIGSVKPDLVWGIWGQGALRWLRVFRRVGYVGKIVWTANVLPNDAMRSELSGIRQEGLLYKNWLHTLDGLVLTNSRMTEYVAARYPRCRGSQTLEMPDFMPARWFARDVGPPLDPNRSNVIYLGSPERWGQTLDYVDQYLQDIAEAGVNVYCARPKETAISHPHVHFYPRWEDGDFLNGRFGQFVQQFDAVVVMYNRTGYYARFASTYPTRFLMALCGRIPVFVKKGLLLACEEFVESFRVGKSYGSATELKGLLMDQSAMKTLRANAANNIERFAADSPNNAIQLKTFLDSA